MTSLHHLPAGTPLRRPSPRRSSAVPPDAGTFSDAEVEDCDEPVRRYFRSAITPGTALARAARMRMRGSIRVGKRWLPFRAHELLADDDRRILADIPVGAELLTLRITIDHGGLVRAAHLDRWGDPDATGQFDWRPFGIDVARSRTFPGGLTMPAEGTGGWFHATDRWNDGEFLRYKIHDLALVTAA